MGTWACARRLPVMGLVKRRVHLQPDFVGVSSSPVTFRSKTDLSLGSSALSCLSVSIDFGPIMQPIGNRWTGLDGVRVNWMVWCCKLLNFLMKIGH